MDIASIIRQLFQSGRSAEPATAATSNAVRDAVLLEVNTLLQARVAEVLSDTLSILDVVGMKLKAQTEVPLIQGQQLALKVISNSPTTMLQIISNETPQTRDNAIVKIAMREVLPRQVAMHKLTELLTQALREKDVTSVDRIPSSAREPIRAFIENAIPVQRLITAQGLREAINNSGIFLEKRVARALQDSSSPQEQLKDISSNDLKSTLLRLVDSLNRIKQVSPAPDSHPKVSSATTENAPNATSMANNTPASATRTAIDLTTRNTLATPGSPASSEIVSNTKGGSTPIVATAKLDSSASDNNSARSHPDVATQKPIRTESHGEPISALQGALPRLVKILAPILGTETRPSNVQTNLPSPAHNRTTSPNQVPAGQDWNSPDSFNEPVMRDPAHLKTTPSLSTTDTVLNTLTKDAEGVLSRQQLHQLASFQSQNQEIPFWSMELPIRWQNELHTLRMRIARDGARRDTQTGFAYHMTLTTEFEPLGPLSARISLRDKQVSIVFTAVRGATVAKAQAAFPLLSTALEANGLQTAGIQCSLVSSVDELDPFPSVDGTLLDLKA